MTTSMLLAACSSSTRDPLDPIRVMQDSGQIEESIPLLIDLIESGNQDGETMYRYGMALSLTGHSERSVWALDAALSDPEWFVPAIHQLAVDAYRAGNADFALELLQRLREERPDSRGDDLPSLLLEARVMLETHRYYEEALELVESIIEKFPDEEEAIRLKAVALLGLKRPDEAYELIRAAGIPASEADEQGADEGVGGEVVQAGEDDEEGAELDLGLNSDKREAYWCAVHATFKREAGEPKVASEIVDECLERFPSDIGLMNEAMKLYSAMGRLDRVLEVLRNANEDSPKDKDIRTGLVKHLTSLGRYQEAEAVLQKAVDDAVADEKAPPVYVASLWVDLAGYLIDRGRVDDALDAFDNATEILGDRASPALLFRQAEALIVAKRYDEALAIADRTPIEVHGPMLRGRIAYERGDYQAALESLDAAALLWPDNAPIRYYLARSAEGLGDFDRAVEEYRQAIRSDPKLSAARERLAELHLAEGRVRHASAILQFISPKKQSVPSTAMRILSVEVQARLGDEPNLEFPPDPAYPLGKLRRDVVRALSRGLRVSVGGSTAESVLSTLEEQVEPDAKGPFLRERVELLLREGSVDAAVAAARAGAKEQIGDDDVRLALGQALVRSGTDLDEAEQLLRGVLERRPDDADALTSLGELALQRQDDASAASFFDRALEIAPAHWPALHRRVEGLLASGQRQAAIERLEVFLARDAPYNGQAALELARDLGEDDATRAKRIELARRAIRFGAGPEAVELLASLDPEAAAELVRDASSPSAPSPSAQGSGPAASAGSSDRDSAGPGSS